MNSDELSKLLKWAEQATSQICFAFGVNRAGEGVLILSQRRKGAALLHDLVQRDGTRELTARRFGTVDVDGEARNLLFTPNKTFKRSAESLLRTLIKGTRYKHFSLTIARVQDDADE